MPLGHILKPGPLFAMWFTVLVAICSVAGADDSTEGSSVPRHGFVQCALAENPPPVPVYELPCSPKPFAVLPCGESVVVAGRQGPWLRIRSTDGTDRYIGFLSVSLSRKKFQPVDLPPGSDPDMRSCVDSLKLPDAQPSAPHRPRAIRQVDPEYPEGGARARISGSVLLSLTVGTDGLAHDVKVTESLGHDFDENAVLAVQQWVFEPAAENGKAVPAEIKVEVNFNIAKR